ncbi:L-threonylcarbamoyladenylate synthase [Treponema putidum]|uniref:L-threonylcarbamoyladenylate synthase n=1 Tax=Treponema putidum TaxID=221027 RepID=A0AAE9MU13_9SPIR|nr:L-threonylcarbamoyladenylate synthase [Treponema putidum]AIN94732.1 translation factor Sua5 [Treponema putidum]TWI77605.1 L-threonylcarbamoyladenylate synthase [Treponema putidum]UTY28753.1 Sua5/YciO/YrdC/YwlC family protein [Treponema putidum]UTY31182.1 Sua5/YciO/YrdC/YwlC family protein [Treponema putidum]UTY33620.1 Sua5/YciO/YrdC/YwlC family protein [Treponema putidum]
MVISKQDPKALELAVSILKKGEIIIIPTDTVYGFSGIIPFTKEKIIKIKKRGAEKSFIGLIEKPQDIYKYTDTFIPSYILELWPAPLSIIVKDRTGGGTSAFRCPDDKWLRDLIGKTGSPIYSTSVNYSGEPVLSNIGDIIREFEDKVSLIIDGGEQKGLASTIVSLIDKEPCIIRQGSLNLSFLTSSEKLSK